MTHELLTPLTGIINGIQLLRSDLDDDNIAECRQLCSVIEESGNSLHMTISNILDYTSMDSREITLFEDQIETQSLINFIQSRFNEPIVEKGLKFHLTSSKNIPEIFISDIRRLKQIIYNLISNAIKFTEVGSISVNISGNQNYLEIAISDTGVGISTERVSTIFNEFTQEDSSYSRSFGGSGLGLSLVKKIVNMLDGNISVNTEPDKGSTFTVNLPVKIKKKVKFPRPSM